MDPATAATSLTAAVKILTATVDLYEHITGVSIPDEARDLVAKIRQQYEPTAREILASLDLLGITLYPAARNHLDAIARANTGHDAAADIRRERMATTNPTTPDDEETTQ